MATFFKSMATVHNSNQPSIRVVDIYPNHTHPNYGKMKLQLKQLKTAGGDETLRFTTELYLDRHKIAIVSNGGTGGGNQYDFLGTDSRSMFTDYIDRLRTKPLEVADLLHQKLGEFLQDFQAIVHTFTQQDIDADIVVSCAIELQEDLKFFNKQCKNKTLFRLPEDPKNEYLTVEKSFSPELESWLVTKYGTDVIIVNKLLARPPEMSKFYD